MVKAEMGAILLSRAGQDGASDWDACLEHVTLLPLSPLSPFVSVVALQKAVHTDVIRLTFMESFKQQEQLRNCIEANFTAILSKLDSNHDFLQNQDISVLAGLDDLTRRVIGLRHTQIDNHEALMRTVASVPAEISKHLSELNSKLDRLPDQRATANARSLRDQVEVVGKAELSKGEQSVLPITNGQKGK
jgi:hypothetical protein